MTKKTTETMAEQTYYDRGAMAIHRIIVDVIQNFTSFLEELGGMTNDPASEQMIRKYYDKLFPLCETWKNATPAMKNAAQAEWNRIKFMMDTKTDEESL